MEKIPILKLGDLLLITIQVDMHDRLAIQLQEDLTTRVVKEGVRGVLIDISSVEMVDSFMGHMLSQIAATTRALGSITVVVGMRPAVAITIVELGLDLNNILTALNIDRGISLLNEMLERPLKRGER